ncbi:YitT family protein [Staphylococcus massiliensis]|uniref:DUF2179 domain-containing protein n=1 Tax=Staphylococcus massiliensis S46 TaxID=1229783 RepID=K9ARE5_9STAP|nr:YitT family protein [Staphylococcus massiliensis]EKU48616.1 hypothetical protein C273_05395 [Staphylococcus massiliensis S46]MCG3400261.1 YitT family protein [Staphylococcus massiliensis]MCG3401891.1 YitT family protein [Staphylococcus massiliensis]MCG3413145.1 YitT family protein [Staphylococcus massiliensis]PNZ98443.1 YitT family protein [Staphylococcus massiliensis CCUG 55927]
MKELKIIAIVILGSLLIALGINGFVIPTQLAEGGAIGISLILFYSFKLPTFLTSLIINILLLIVGWKYLSKQKMLYTLVSVIFLSVFLKVTLNVDFHIDSPIIGVIFGGIIIGLGTGLIIAYGGTFGSTSILAKIFNEYFHVPTSRALFLIDSVIVLSALLVLPVERVLFTIMLLFVISKTMSFILEGLNPKKGVYIISKENHDISKSIYDTIGRGSTVISAKGQYSQVNRDMLFIVISNSQLPKLKKLIKRYDQDAFVVVNDVREIFGEGFIKIP